jgi:hypothetical protein
MTNAEYEHLIILPLLVAALRLPMMGPGEAVVVVVVVVARLAKALQQVPEAVGVQQALPGPTQFPRLRAHQTFLHQCLSAARTRLHLHLPGCGVSG